MPEPSLAVLRQYSLELAKSGRKHYFDVEPVKATVFLRYPNSSLSRSTVAAHLVWDCPNQVVEGHMVRGNRVAAAMSRGALGTA